MSPNSVFDWDSGQEEQVWDTDQNIRTSGGIVAGSVAITPAAGEVSGTKVIARGDGSSYGVAIGTDGQIYRSAANTLKTDNHLIAKSLTTSGHIPQDGNAMIYGGLYSGYGSGAWAVGMGCVSAQYSGRFGYVVAGDHQQAGVANTVMIKEASTPTNPTTGYGYLFARTDGFPAWKNDGGWVFPIIDYKIDIPIRGAVLSYATDSAFSGTATPIIAFPDTGTGIADFGGFAIPKGWIQATTKKLNIWWSQLTSGTGNVYWHAVLTVMRHGYQIIYASLASGSVFAPANGTALYMVKSTITLSSWAAAAEGDAFSLRLVRYGADGNDTLSSTAGVAAIQLTIGD